MIEYKTRPPLYSTGSWVLFGKHGGYDVMANGNANSMAAARDAVKAAIATLGRLGWTGR